MEVGGLPSRLTPDSPPSRQANQTVRVNCSAPTAPVHPLKKLKYSVLTPPPPTYPQPPPPHPHHPRPPLTTPNSRLLQILLLPFLVATFFPSRLHAFLLFSSPLLRLLSPLSNYPILPVSPRLR